MTKHIEDIMKGLDVLHLTCDAIQQGGGCSVCPLKKRDCCLEETDALTLAEVVTKKVWTDFLEFSDDVQSADFCPDEEDDECIDEELLMEEYYARLPRKEIKVYGHNITIIT